jgi:hypothetical protein
MSVCDFMSYNTYADSDDSVVSYLESLKFSRVYHIADSLKDFQASQMTHLDVHRLEITYNITLHKSFPSFYIVHSLKGFQISHMIHMMCTGWS